MEDKAEGEFFLQQLRTTLKDNKNKLANLSNDPKQNFEKPKTN